MRIFQRNQLGNSRRRLFDVKSGSRSHRAIQDRMHVSPEEYPESLSWSRSSGGWEDRRESSASGSFGGYDSYDDSRRFWHRRTIAFAHADWKEKAHPLWFKWNAWSSVMFLEPDMSVSESMNLRVRQLEKDVEDLRYLVRKLLANQ